MAMNPREKLLATGVGLTIGLFGLQYGFSTIRKQFNDKQALIDSARSEADSLQTMFLQGMASQRKINDLKSKSLPTNEQYLAASYADWLTKLAEQSGMEDIRVSKNERPSKTSPALKGFKFTLQCQCRTDQLLDFLGNYYERDLLHSITALKCTMAKKTAGPLDVRENLLNVSLDSEAISLRIADAKQPLSEAKSNRLAKSIEEYKKSILENNPFAPPNQPPKLATRPTQEVKRGEDWRLKLEGQDPEAHLVKFELVSTELPPGLKFSERSGELSWKPTENGSHEITVRATDNGLPARSSEFKMALKVVDPPPPVVKPVEKKFDPASQSKISGMVGGREGPQAWVRSLADGKRFELSEGADFEIGTIKAKVVSINLKESFVELETEGRRWTVGMDEALSDAFEKSKKD
jgi:Putative Ig domain